MRVFALRIREHPWPASPIEVLPPATSRDMLLELLDEKAAQALDRSFRSLQILRRGEDMRSIATAAHSRDRRTRAQAMEYIDTLTLDTSREQVRRLFALVLDDLPFTESVQRLNNGIGVLPTTGPQALLMLAEGDDETLAAIAAYYMFELRDAKFAEGISQVIRRARGPLLDHDVIRLLTRGARSAHAH